MDSDRPVPDRNAAKWNKDNDGPLILFQMTISMSHPVNTSELVYVLSKLEFLERLEHVKLVFVVPKKLVGRFKRQTIDLVTAVGTDSVRKIRGIGRATSALLSQFGIRTINDLETEVNLRGNIKKQKTTNKTKEPTLKDADPERWDQIVELWEQHELTVKYGEKVAAIA
ncbi:hypothetical protein PF010_g26105 [Phytophthora fragariae]|uniref:DUF4332 domain-containing protein n=1 Tax=Phytophthora fragariae TaxID=53985 RepID=A0A6G0JYM7_9STRA|nr:hypothetical protein PF010_g26105 [Phytophthora fragariae]